MDTPISSKPKSKEKEYVSEYNRQRYLINKSTVAARQKRYYELNKNVILKRHQIYTKNKYHNSPQYKLRTLVSRAVAYGLKKNGQSVTKYLIYTFDQLKLHLEIHFEPWMNWDNHGVYDSENWDDNNSTTWTWQLDHVIPQSELLYNSMEDDNFKKCWALENLRPLSAKQNHLDGINRSRHLRK